MQRQRRRPARHRGSLHRPRTHGAEQAAPQSGMAAQRPVPPRAHGRLPRGRRSLRRQERTLAARLGAKISLRRSLGFLNGQSFPAWRGEWRWERRQHWNVKQDGEVVAIRASRAREFYDVGVADEPHVFALASGVLTHNSKPNGLPESVTDRCRSSHEYLFHMVRQPRYYAAVDEIREPHTYPDDMRHL